MEKEYNDKKMESIYSKRLRAGKRRTYFFDVRATKGNDYYLTITESRKRFDDNGYDRHKVFLYKEDFNKFVKALNEAVDYVKTELMPDFDFSAFNHDPDEEEPITNPSAPAQVVEAPVAETTPEPATTDEQPELLEPPKTVEPEPDSSSNTTNTLPHEEVDKW